jgi:hypothetical protein
VLDTFEELIHHTVKSGQVEAAWGIYEQTLGGFHHLAVQLNDYGRGARITELLLDSLAENDRLDGPRRLTVRRRDELHEQLTRDRRRFLESLTGGAGG